MDNQVENSAQERRLAAIRPFQYPKGVSGNPAGRPRGEKSLVRELRRRLAEEIDEEGHTRLDQIVDLLFERAIRELEKGDGRPMQALYEILDRTAPKRLSVEVSPMRSRPALSDLDDETAIQLINSGFNSRPADAIEAVLEQETEIAHEDD